MDLESRKKTLVWYIYGILNSNINIEEKIKLIKWEVENIIEEELRRKEKSVNVVEEEN